MAFNNFNNGWRSAPPPPPRVQVRMGATAGFSSAAAGAVELLNDQLLTILSDGGFVPIRLKNATGSAIEAGDVVAINPATGEAFNGSAAEAGGIILTWVIAVEHIEPDAVGAFGTTGVMPAKVSLNSGAAVAAQTWLEKDLTTGSTSLHSLGISFAGNNQPAPPNGLAYTLQEITAAGLCLVYFPGGPRSDWPSSTWFEFFEDFLSNNNGGDATNLVETWNHVWRRTSAATDVPFSPGGIISLAQTGAGAVPYIYAANPNTTFVTFVDAIDCMLEIRCALQGDVPGSGQRRYGLWGETPGTSLPIDGILLTHANTNNMFVRVLVSGVETNLDTGTPQLGESFTWRIQHDSVAGAFLVWRNGVYIGRVVSDPPLARLGPGFHGSAAGSWAYIDFIRVRSRR